ncbi:MAG: hypothetical protein Kilf2KO_02790 [Rhodospirillales bacterium]
MEPKEGSVAFGVDGKSPVKQRPVEKRAVQGRRAARRARRAQRRHWLDLEAEACRRGSQSLASSQDVGPPPVLKRLVEQLHALQARGVPRTQIRIALGLNEACAEAYGLGPAQPTPDPFAVDPRRRRTGQRRGQRKRRMAADRSRAEGRR